MMNKKIGKAMVVGGGIAGIRSALDLAECGYSVYLVERTPHLGGMLSQLDNQFPTNHCGMCKMLPLLCRDDASQFCLRKGLFHENIELLPASEVKSVSGEAGRFQVSLRQAESWVDPRRCVGCGRCSEVCPVTVPDTFNAGLGLRKAIHRPVPHGVGDPFVIDPDGCNRCGECQRVCPTGAVQLAHPSRSGFRILVVDDELVVRDSLKELLADEGYAVAMAESGPEALEMLAREPFALMLTDIKMPGMDGVALLTEAKARHPDLEIVMMTAYATVETAVEAMKIGARDYLMKPFEPDVLIPMIQTYFERRQAGQDRRLEVGAIILSAGSGYFDPGQKGDIWGYGVNPHVLTNLQFERLLSGSGPWGGRLLRPADQKPVTKIAWLQCVGSRDRQLAADFCSSVCCMIAVKEALLAKEKSGGAVETTIFYMDMRTYGKSFQRYRDAAETRHGVRFERVRIHSLDVGTDHDDPRLRYVGRDGRPVKESFDLVVLSVGQRPPAGAGALAEMMALTPGEDGFIAHEPFSPALTQRKGILMAGSFGGLKDISESLIQASAAANQAQRVIHAAGGSLALSSAPETAAEERAVEPSGTLVLLCGCNGRLAEVMDPNAVGEAWTGQQAVDQVLPVDQLCTDAGWQAVVAALRDHPPARLLIGACHPYGFLNRLRQLSREIGLDPALVDVVDLAPFAPDLAPSAQASRRADLNMALARLSHRWPQARDALPVCQRALVVGGGIAGMQAALAIAELGYPVDLVEQADQLGGNLLWLRHTVEGLDPRQLLAESEAQIQAHPHIQVRTGSRIAGAFGQAGHFFSTVTDKEGRIETLEHGVTILATGGCEAKTESFGYGRHAAVVTQMELEQGLAEQRIDPARLETVVMIQCVDSRKEPRNYCSRVCCGAALKHALNLTAQNPQVSVYVLYRDMMTYGFSEAYYTRAREQGVLFITYPPDQAPRVAEGDGERLQVHVVDPILGRPLEISADLVVLATGIVPRLPAELAEAYGVETDADGFFQEAESKWRPVDALKEGVFACGLAISPRSITESVATAQAAAQRAMRILGRDQLPLDHQIAHVRASLCALCERCIETCPYGARSLDPEQQAVVVNAAMCQGCGACAAVCPNKASVVRGLETEMVLEVIDQALR
jgi:heterodisulfide reductase subunit A